MNLRTLKKLSKRAAPYLPLLGDQREQFPAKRWENYHGLRIRARKHWDRNRCHPTYNGVASREDEIVYTSRAGHRITMYSPFHPRKGTVMVGAMEGYYEPEWSEQTAWGALCDMVYCQFTDWGGEEFSAPIMTRTIKTPRDVFAAADEILQRASHG